MALPEHFSCVRYAGGWYNSRMVRHVDAIFTNGAFRPVVPLTMPEGTRVQLSVEEAVVSTPPLANAAVRSPKLVRREDAADFVMHVEIADDAEV